MEIILGYKMTNRARLVLIINAFVTFLLFSAPVQAGEFPIGSLKGIGFRVERGDVVITSEDLYKFELNAIVRKLDANRIQITTEAILQRTKDTKAKKEVRVDTYKIEWNGANSGSLINEASLYRDDKSTFTLEGETLTVKSWISRNKLWETHVYTKSY